MKSNNLFMRCVQSLKVAPVSLPPSSFSPGGPNSLVLARTNSLSLFHPLPSFSFYGYLSEIIINRAATSVFQKVQSFFLMYSIFCNRTASIKSTVIAQLYWYHMREKPSKIAIACLNMTLALPCGSLYQVSWIPAKICSFRINRIALASVQDSKSNNCSCKNKDCIFFLSLVEQLHPTPYQQTQSDNQEILLLLILLPYFPRPAVCTGVRSLTAFGCKQ